MSEIIRSIEKAQLRTDLPEFGIGDTVRVFVKVVEGNLYGSPRVLRHWRRTHVPAAFSPPGPHRSDPSW